MTIKSDLDRLAVALLKQAQERTKSDDHASGDTLDLSVDIFKAVAAYHIGAQRVAKGKSGDDEQDSPSFQKILRQVNGASTKGGTA
jgi:hypothetical protein